MAKDMPRTRFACARTLHDIFRHCESPNRNVAAGSQQFQKQRRLILRGLSLNGIIVTYDGQGGDKRRTIVTKDDQGREKPRHFIWILSDENISSVDKIVIDIQNIKFRIIVSKHETYPDSYNDNVDRFLREANANNELPFDALGIQSTTSTAQQSETTDRYSSGVDPSPSVDLNLFSASPIKPDLYKVQLVGKMMIRQARRVNRLILRRTWRFTQMPKMCIFTAKLRLLSLTYSWVM